MNNISTKEIKDKFASYINKLIVCNNLSTESISDKIIENDLFDFLEENKIEEFMSLTYEKFVYQLFGIYSVYQDDHVVTKIDWVSKMYLTICFNKLIPLKTVVLLCPIQRMVDYFDVYHQMNDEQFVDYYMENIYKNSILKEIRKKRNLSIKELSFISGISENSIKYYEKDNNNLFDASFIKINNLKKALNISISVFKKESDYVPFMYSFISDENTRSMIKEDISNIYNADIEVLSYEPLLQIRKNNKKQFVSKQTSKSIYDRVTKRVLKDKNLF